MITIVNQTTDSIILTANDGMQYDLLPNQSMTLSLYANKSFYIRHYYKSRIVSSGIFSMREGACIVLDAVVTIANEGLHSDVVLFITQRKDMLENPKWLEYDYFSISVNKGNRPIICYYVADKESITKKIDRIETKEILIEIILNNLFFVILEPFVLIAFILSEHKLVFLLLFIILTVMIAIISLVSYFSFQKRNKNLTLKDGLRQEFIDGYFSSKKS